MNDRDGEFVEFVRRRGRDLRQTAYLLCGDWHRAEDHAQTTLLKLYRAWRRVHSEEAVDAYARTVLVRSVIDDARRRRPREYPTAELPEVAVTAATPEAGWDALGLLARLPPRQRAAVVLRYWEDLSVADTAKALRCGEGTVKSQCSKGLATLRRELETDQTGTAGGYGTNRKAGTR